MQLSLPIVHWQIPVRESQSARLRTGVLPMKFTSEKPHCSCALSVGAQPQMRVPSVEITHDSSRLGLLHVLHAMRRPVLSAAVHGHVGPTTSARATSGSDAGAASLAGTRSSVTAPQPASANGNTNVNANPILEEKTTHAVLGFTAR